MRSHLIFGARMIMFVSVLTFGGFLSNQLFAVAASKKVTKKQSKKAVVKKQKPTKIKSVQKAPIKAITPPTELDMIRADKDAGQWEMVSPGVDTDNIRIDVFAVGPDKVRYGVDKETKTLYEDSGNGWEKKINDAIVYVTVAMNGLVILLNDQGEIFKYQSNKTTKIAESAHKWNSIAALDESMMWAIEYNEGVAYGKLYLYLGGFTSNWNSIKTGKGLEADGLRDVFVTPEALWVIDYKSQAYTKKLEIWERGQ